MISFKFIQYCFCNNFCFTRLRMYFSVDKVKIIQLIFFK